METFFAIHSSVRSFVCLINRMRLAIFINVWTRLQSWSALEMPNLEQSLLNCSRAEIALYALKAIFWWHSSERVELMIILEINVNKWKRQMDGEKWNVYNGSIIQKKKTIFLVPKNRCCWLGLLDSISIVSRLLNLCLQIMPWNTSTESHILIWV